MAQFVFVFGRHHDHPGQRPEVRQVVEPVVSRAVGAHNARAVERERNGGVHQADVVDHLVVGALEESRVDGRHRPHSLARQAAGEGHGVLLGDAHIKEAVGKTPGEFVEPRALLHCRRDGDDPRVLLGQIADGLAEDRSVGRRLRGRLVERAG